MFIAEYLKDCTLQPPWAPLPTCSSSPTRKFGGQWRGEEEQQQQEQEDVNSGFEAVQLAKWSDYDLDVDDVMTKTITRMPLTQEMKIQFPMPARMGMAMVTTKKCSSIFTS